MTRNTGDVTPALSREVRAFCLVIRAHAVGTGRASWEGMTTTQDMVGRKVRISDGRFGVIEHAAHELVGKWRGASSSMTRLVLTVRVGSETLKLAAKNVELV